MGQGKTIEVADDVPLCHPAIASDNGDAIRQRWISKRGRVTGSVDTGRGEIIGDASFNGSMTKSGKRSVGQRKGGIVTYENVGEDPCLGLVRIF